MAYIGGVIDDLYWMALDNPESGYTAGLNSSGLCTNPFIQLILSRGDEPKVVIGGYHTDTAFVAVAQAPDGRCVRKTFRVADDYTENVGKRREHIDVRRLYADLMEFANDIVDQEEK